MLFAQAALALAACNMERTPSRAAALSMQTQAEAPCHEEASANDALCAPHCVASDPSFDKTPAQPSVAPVLALAPLAVRMPVSRPGALPPTAAPPPASPPARILFQTLLI